MTLLALTLALASFSAPPAAEAAVHWRGDRLDLADLPTDLPQGAQEAALYWAPWAGEHRFSMWFTDDARILVVDDSKKISSREWKLVEATMASVDALVPLPPRDEQETRTGTQEASSDGGMTWSWGDSVELEHETAAFFRLSGSKEFRSLLEYVAERDEQSAGFAERFEDLSGIVLHKPLCGVIVDNAPGVEEWDPMNEMVNRLARLLVARRFGNVPNWISMGIAWHVEMEVRGNIFCFPHRSSFVGVAEHNGWKADLKKQFKKKSGDPLDLNRLSSWKRGTYDPIQASRAWGTVGYVQEMAPGALALVIEDLRLLTEDQGKIHHPDGTWELIPGWEPGPDLQLEVLERRVHEEFLEGVTEYFRKGMKASKRR